MGLCKEMSLVCSWKKEIVEMGAAGGELRGTFKGGYTGRNDLCAVGMTHCTFCF